MEKILKIKELMSKMENLYPLKNSLSWDNSGLIIGDYEHEVHKCLIVMDVEIDTVDYAIEKNYDLIISHHPLIYKGIKKIIKGDFNFTILKKILDNNINILCYHTPFDCSKQGMNDSIFSSLGAEVDCLFEEESLKFGTIIEVDKDIKGIDLINICKNHFPSDRLNEIMYYGDLSKSIHKIAFIGGSGGDYISHAIKKESDIIITGDLKYHQIQEALRNNISVLDLGHYLSEIQFYEIMKKLLDEFEMDNDIFEKSIVKRVSLFEI